MFRKDHTFFSDPSHERIWKEGDPTMINKSIRTVLNIHLKEWKYTSGAISWDIDRKKIYSLSEMTWWWPAFLIALKFTGMIVEKFIFTCWESIETQISKLFSGSVAIGSFLSMSHNCSNRLLVTLKFPKFLFSLLTCKSY